MPVSGTPTPAGQRQADALADTCGYVLDHGGTTRNRFYESMFSVEAAGWSHSGLWSL